jgi:amino acid adenylation domain-containing protein
LFARQAASAPNATAIICGAETITYAELNDRANQLAHFLLRRGLKQEECVGICMKRSISMIVAMLAVLKAGGVYLPLDPAYPPQRLETMLNDSRTRIVCSEGEVLTRLTLGEHEIISTDAEAKAIEQMSRSNPAVDVHPNNLAYVIYTSGSTGQPKGVAIEHHSTVSLLHWGRTTYTPSELARVLASTSICFDLSVFEIFLPLSWGHAIVLVDDILQLAQASAVSRPTLINTVPSAMTALLAAGGIPNSVLCVNLAGEPLSTSLVKRIEERIPSVRIFDLYGPTETTTYSTFARRRSSAPATIGRPLANTQIFILDAYFKPLPPGVPGQIFIGGEGVARGYLHHPELTAERFLTIEDLPTAGRLYQTGDLARYRHDGSIEYLGRMDQQVKIRGFRIELGEIENVLRQHPKVKDAVVVMQRDAALDSSLAAYVTASSRPPYPAELLAFQRQYLPSSMVANEIVVLNHLPLTPNGKVDRKALMERRIDATEKAVVPDAPLTDIERKLVSIWEKHFNRSPIGIDEDFFALGGHSLLAFRIFSEIEKRLRAPLLLSLLFRAPTIRLLATEIERQGPSKAKGDEERRA